MCLCENKSCIEYAVNTFHEDAAEAICGSNVIDGKACEIQSILDVLIICWPQVSVHSFAVKIILTFIAPQCAKLKTRSQEQGLVPLHCKMYPQKLTKEQRTHTNLWRETLSAVQ